VSKIVNKRIISGNFKILKPTKKSVIPFPAFVFSSVKQINIEKIKTVVFSAKRKVLFFVFHSEDFVVVPLNSVSLYFFKRKKYSNIVLYNCELSEIENIEGVVVSMFYEED